MSKFRFLANARIGLGGTAVLVSTAFLVLLIVWSLWAELDQVSRAPGQVIPSGRVQLVQSNEGGVITDILVREGDIVKAGQLLVKLDDVSIRAGVDEARGKVASLLSSQTRINAELFNRPLIFPEEVAGFPEFKSNQTLLYRRRREALDDQLNALNSMLVLARRELAMNEPLLAAGDISEADVIRLKRGVVDIESQIVNVQNTYTQDLQTEYTRTEEELVSAREILAQRLESLRGTEIRAPAAGIVKNVRLTTIGGVLRPSDEVLTVVPSGDTLIVEAKVSPADIAYIRKGQGASIRFDAYDSSIYGSAEGVVTFISPDTISEQTGDGDLVYYRVYLSVDTSPMSAIQADEPVVVQAGMTSSVEILTGKNTVFNYLTKPITKTLDEALKEK
jgi:adhesin transport system membrane fusion protein